MDGCQPNRSCRGRSRRQETLTGNFNCLINEAHTRRPTMNSRYLALCTGAVLAAIALQGAPANAMSMTDCSAKYKAAKADGSLNGMKWNDFRKAQCGADATAAP